MQNGLILLAVALSVWIWYYASRPSPPPPEAVQPPDGQAPDVLAATTLKQWQDMIRDLQPDSKSETLWATKSVRKGTPPVLLNFNSQTILFKAQCITVNLDYPAKHFQSAQIRSPALTVDQTRELGLKICAMFDMDAVKFSDWCDKFANNWMEARLVEIADNSSLHSFKILRGYNDDAPWSIELTTRQPAAAIEVK